MNPVALQPQINIFLFMSVLTKRFLFPDQIVPREVHFFQIRPWLFGEHRNSLQKSWIYPTENVRAKPGRPFEMVLWPTFIHDKVWTGFKTRVGALNP